MSLRLEFAETVYQASKKNNKISVIVGDISHGIFKNLEKIHQRNISI